MKRIIILIMLFLVSLTSAIATSSELDVEVEVDGDELEEGDKLAVERGQNIEIKVRIKSEEEMEDVQIKAMITGYEHGIISDITPVFDVKEDTRYRKYLELEIPFDIEVFEENEGDYKLRILITDRDGETLKFDYELTFEADRHSVAIKDLLLSPSKEVVAGRGLIASVRLKNYGQKEEESIKVIVSIPDLDIEDSEFVDSLDIDDSITTEDMFLRIRQCASPGEYDINVLVEFDDGYDSVERDFTIDILENPACTGTGGTGGGAIAGQGGSSTTVTLPRKVDLFSGPTGQLVPIVITNRGPTSKSYSIKLSAFESWGNAYVEGGSVVLVGPHQTETKYIFVKANEETETGEQIFVIDISSRNEMQNAVITADIINIPTLNDNSNDNPIGDMKNLKGYLEIGLLALVALLILLGIFAGMARLQRR